MTVASILARKGRNVLTISTDTSINEAVRILAERRVGALVVADSMGRILGIVSERDVVRLLARAGAASLAGPVSTIMTAKVVTCTDVDTINQVMERMTEGRFRHLPVVDDGRLAGIISIGDVVAARISELAMEKDALEGMIKGN